MTAALEAGYRSIDTAALCRNESAVGRAIADSALPREDVFVTTKVWNSDQGFDSTLAAFGESIQHLGLDYIARTPILGLAAKYAKTPAQLVLRWHLQLGNVVIPKSVTPARIRENLSIFDFEIADDDMVEISAMDTGARVGPDPATFNGA